MATHVPCKKNDASGYVFYVSLVSQANTKIFQANPTYAAGDIKVAVEDAAPGNVSAVAIDADFTKRVKITLSQAQTNGDNLTVICSDAAGNEWCDLTINIQTSAQTLDETDAVVDAITAAGPTKAEMDTAHGLLTTPAQVATALTNYDAPTKAEMDNAHALLATVAKQDIIDTVVDGIQTDLSNVTDGLGALKALIDAVKAETALVVADTSELQTDWVNGGRLDLLIDAITTYVDLIDDATNGLIAIKAEVEGLAGATMRGTDSAALAANWTAALATALANYTAARAGYLDELAAANIPADVDTLKAYCDILDHATNGLANIKALIDLIKAKSDNLPSGLPKNVALSNFAFLMVLSADHITPATGITVTAQISKDGGAFVNCTNAVAEVANGVYKISLIQAEMNADIITLKFTEATCDQRTITLVTST